MKKYESHSLLETSEIARGWLYRIEATKSPIRATLVGLSGHLGAGKTAFVKCVSKHLGIPAEITSPTFVLMKIYPTNHTYWKKMVHIDAYRLDNKKQIDILHLEKFTSDPSCLIFVEWPENVELKQSYPDMKMITFEVEKDIHTICTL